MTTSLVVIAAVVLGGGAVTPLQCGLRAERVVLAALGTAERLEVHDPRGALVSLERVESRLDSLPARCDRWKSRLYQLKGDLHWNLWQFVDALDSWKLALPGAQGRDRRSLAAAIARVEQVIEGESGERGVDSVYFAAPNVGPAARLKGHVAVAYVFLQDAAGHPWSLRRRELALSAWERAERWLDAAAHRYGAAVRFSRRLFIVDRNPDIGRLRIGSIRRGYENARGVADLVARQLGAPSVLALLERVRREAGADQSILLLHLARDDRSFSCRCVRQCGPSGEYAYVMESVTPKLWEGLEHAQAHETLHLFGAADLYTLRGAKYYAPRDVMNYPSRLLVGSTVEPVTAFAVGLLTAKPAAPFTIITF